MNLTTLNNNKKGSRTEILFCLNILPFTISKSCYEDIELFELGQLIGIIVL